MGDFEQELATLHSALALASFIQVLLLLLLTYCLSATQTTLKCVEKLEVHQQNLKDVVPIHWQLFQSGSFSFSSCFLRTIIEKIVSSIIVWYAPSSNPFNIYTHNNIFNSKINVIKRTWISSQLRINIYYEYWEDETGLRALMLIWFLVGMVGDVSKYGHINGQLRESSFTVLIFITMRVFCCCVKMYCYYITLLLLVTLLFIGYWFSSTIWRRSEWCNSIVYSWCRIKESQLVESYSSRFTNRSCICLDFNINGRLHCVLAVTFSVCRTIIPMTIHWSQSHDCQSIDIQANAINYQ